MPTPTRTIPALPVRDAAAAHGRLGREELHHDRGVAAVRPVRRVER
jgi:hypothetical protein